MNNLIDKLERADGPDREMSDLRKDIAAFEQACWKVLAYDQFLRSITTPAILCAGDAPDLDAVYDNMIKAVTNALALRARSQGGE